MIDVGGRLIGVEEPYASDYLREVVEPAPDAATVAVNDKQQAHADYIRDLESAWRNPVGSVPASDGVVSAPGAAASRSCEDAGVNA